MLLRFLLARAVVFGSPRLLGLELLGDCAAPGEGLKSVVPLAVRGVMVGAADEGLIADKVGVA